MLTYSDVVRLYPDSKGVKVITLVYRCLSLDSSIQQPKWLVISSKMDRKILRANGNRSISALWLKSMPISVYTLNDFPVIFVNDLKEAMVKLIHNYEEKIILKKRGDATKMIFSSKDLQKENMFYRIFCLVSGCKDGMEMGNEGK